MSKSPPRPSDHSPSCPAYSPSAKYADCTCGLTTPRKRKRPTISEATEKALAVDAVETEAERKGRERREAMEAAMMAPGTTQQKQAVAACPRCSECVGQKHHWIESGEVYGPEDPPYICKHCDAACGMRADGGPSGKPMARRTEPEPEDEIPDPWTTGAVEDAIAAGDRIRAIGRDQRQLDEIADAVSSMSQRLVALRRNHVNVPFDRPVEVGGDWPVQIHQVCPACREQHFVALPLDVESKMAAIAAVGSAARKARLRHACPAITTQLPATMNRADLEALAQQLERDGTEMVKRSIEIAAMAKERTA